MQLNRDYISTFKFLKSKPDFKLIKSVCDLGSGIPVEIYRMMNSLDNLKATPVDKGKIPKVDEFPFDLKYLERNSENHERLFDLDLEDKFEELKTNDFLYNEYLVTCLVDKNEPKSESVFYKSLNKDFFELSLQDFLNKEEQKFDLIIMSKTLSHTEIKYHKSIIKGINQILNQKGKIFIRLNYKGYTTLNLATVATHNQIKNTFEIIEEFPEKITETKSHYVYYGKKKN